MTISNIFILAATGALIGAFQNCSPVKFSEIPSGKLVASATTDGTGLAAGLPPGPVPNASSPGLIIGDGVPNGNAPAVASDGKDDDGSSSEVASNGKDDDDNDGDSPKVKPDGKGHDGGTKDYVCILQGSGHSVKLTYSQVNNSVQGDTGNSDVCMSAKACTDIVSEKFQVQEPEPRGFCKKSDPGAQAVQFSDSQIQALINKI